MRNSVASWVRLGRREIGWLAAILLLAGSVLTFLEIAEAVGEGEIASFDRAVLLAMREPTDLADPVGPEWLEQAVRDVTSLGGYTVLTLVVLAVAGFLFVSGRHAAAWLVIVSVCGGTLVSQLLKTLFQRTRPDLVPHVVEVSSASFPSGHAMLSAVTYLTLGALLARVQPQPVMRIYLYSVATALTLLVGTSRVYLGVHWPSDVLAGWCVGASWAILCWLVAAWLQKRGSVEGEPPRVAEAQPIRPPVQS